MKLMYKEDRKELIRQVLTKDYSRGSFTIETIKSISRWPLLETIKKDYPSISIKKKIRIFRNNDPYKKGYLGLIITFKGKKHLIFRNGCNASYNNFCFYSYEKEKMYFESTIKGILTLLEIINATEKDLPLILTKVLEKFKENTKESERIKNLIMKKIRGE